MVTCISVNGWMLEGRWVIGLKVGGAHSFHYIWMFILSIFPSIHLSLHPSVPPSVCPSVHCVTSDGQTDVLHEDFIVHWPIGANAPPPTV
jgi:hypothetical protein